MPLTAFLPYFVALGAGLMAIWRAAPYSLVPLALMLSWYAVRQVYMYRDYRPVVETRAGRREAVTANLIGIGMVVLPLATLATPLFDFAAYRATIGQVPLGLAMTILGLWLFFRSHEDLGQNWSPMLETRERQSLVTSGVYSYIRHPMYTAFFLIAFAQALLLNNWLAGPAGVLSFAIFYGLRIDDEEDLMLSCFGADYAQYCARTARLLPRRSLLAKGA